MAIYRTFPSNYPPPPLKKTQKNMTKPLVFPGQKWYYHIDEIIKHHVTVDQGG